MRWTSCYYSAPWFLLLSCYPPLQLSLLCCPRNSGPLQPLTTHDLAFYCLLGARYLIWCIFFILDPQYVIFSFVVVLWVFFPMPQVWSNLDSSRDSYAQSLIMTSLWIVSVERTCMACHVSLFLHSALKFIQRKKNSMHYPPNFTEFQSDTQRESYDNFPKVTSLRWSWGACKNPNFHRSYLWKYCEPWSEIFTWASSGFRLRVIKISASQPLYKKNYIETSTMACFK